MYVQGVSTRKIKAISEELCGHEFSASTISELNKTMDDELEKFARQRLEGEYPYLILDARYEKVREDGVIRSRAVLVAIGIDWEGRRRILGVELAGRAKGQHCLVAGVVLEFSSNLLHWRGKVGGHRHAHRLGLAGHGQQGQTGRQQGAP